MSLFKKLRHILQQVLKRIIPALLKLSMLRLVVLFLTMAILVSVTMVLIIDFLWDGRFNTEQEFTGVIVTFFDSLLIVGLLMALLRELREEVKRFKRVQEEVEFKNTLLQTQQETSLDAILMVNESAQIISYNQQFIDLWRLPPQMVSAGLDAPVLQTCVDQVENSEAFVAKIQWLYEHPNNKSRVEIPLKDGRIIDRYSAPIIGEQGKYYGRVWYFRDITEYKKAEADLRIAATAFESQEGMLVADANNVILRVNSAFTVITGYTANEVIGQNPSILNSGSHDANFYAAMWENINRTGGWEGLIQNRRKNGEIYPELLSITAVKDSNDTVINYVATFTDNTLSNEATDKITRLAFYDSLTGLPNRRLLIDRLHKAFASSGRSGREGALLFVDLDNFKDINDTLGHDIGDLLLQQTAQRLESCLREGDTVARLGGDEFVVMLEDLSEQPIEAAALAKAVGEKILASLSQPYQLATHEYHSTSSIGVTIFSDHGKSAEELLKRADIAMYQAKKAGRNTLRFFSTKMQDIINARTSLGSELRIALEKQQFQLYYQIQVNNLWSPFGAEALIRWLHPERGLVSPIEFIPLAEDIGLILPIGQWVLETACAQLKVWQQDVLTRDLTLSVNVSAKQFHQAEFVAQVQSAVQRHTINPQLLKLELTESILLERIDDTIATMHTLKAIGIRFSLDDFGTGYSSLQYLKRLPLDQLKIDQSFVRNLAADGSDKVIVRTIIAMADSLGLDVIAEGVETEEQRQLLLNKGCTHYQGYLFGKPVPIEQFEELLKQRPSLL